MDIRISRATAGVGNPLDYDGVAWFLDWQRGITGAMEAFRGHRGTDVYCGP